MRDLALAALLSALCILLLWRGGRLEFLRREFADSRHRSIALLLLWVILLIAVFQPTVASSRGDVIAMEDLPFPALFLGHAILLAFLALWWSLRGRPDAAAFIALAPPRAEDLRLGLRYGALCWILGIAASSAVGLVFDGGVDAAATPELPPAMVWLATLPLAYKLITVAVAMTVEEAFFRGFLQQRIGWLPSSVLFALGHAGYGMPRLVASVFVVSLVLGAALRNSGRLLPCIIAHGVFDAVQLLVIIPLAVRMLGG